MQLTQEHKAEVSQWIAQGAKLSEVQQRLAEQFNIRLTYMEARFLVDDLKLVPQEKEEPVKAVAEEVPGDLKNDEEVELLPAEPYTGGVQVRVDQVVRPGALVSGAVTFSDGVKADWYLDQTGRFGLVPPEPGYRPSPGDFSEFRLALEQALAKQGM